MGIQPAPNKAVQLPGVWYFHPFFAGKSQREHEGLSFISSDALKMSKNGNQMAVESRVVGLGCSSLQRTE